jgi:peptidoglycan biosynthesis protein MviN/MurJ (putative lipid II flippase)
MFSIILIVDLENIFLPHFEETDRDDSQLATQKRRHLKIGLIIVLAVGVETKIFNFIFR